MTATARILFFSATDFKEFVDLNILTSNAYDVTTLSTPLAIESWLNTFMEDILLIVFNPSARQGLRYSSEFLKTHPFVPVLLISTRCTLPMMRKALQLGITDFLTTPLDPSKFLFSVQRGLERFKSWKELNHLNRIVNGLKDGFIFTDLDGRLLMVNDTAREIFSLGDNAIEGKLVSEVIHHADLLDVFASQSPFPHRTEIFLEDGRIFGAQASQTTGVGIAVVLQEITHLKELDRIKTDFVNTVSHDLRSPLTAIYGFTGLIDRVGSVNTQQAEFIRHIQSSVQHITSLINDLLELGRVEADYDVQMEEVNLNDIINRSIETLDFQMNEKMQELTLELLEDIPVVLGNPIHLQRMAMNLIENAIKFTPPLGKIALQTKAEADQVILHVVDNGPGITLDDQPRVFDKFFRGNNVSQSTQGTGLGLSIVKSIVDKHHGRIWLDSSPSGTTFTVLLPVK